MAALDFLSSHKVRPQVIFFHHGDDHSEEAHKFVASYCEEKKLKFCVGRINTPKLKEESLEEHWRRNRLHCFHCLDGPVITAHQLDDTCEWWIMSALHGEAKLLPYQNGNVIRPFRATPRSDMLDWCKRHNVPYLEDPCNMDGRFMRSRVRQSIMPEALKVNPGLRKVMLKKVLTDARENPNLAHAGDGSD